MPEISPNNDVSPITRTEVEFELKGMPMKDDIRGSWYYRNHKFIKYDV